MDPFGAKSRAKVPEGFGGPRALCSCVGTVTSLQAHRLARRSGRRRASAPALPRATLYFDLGSPYTYLAAERAERLFAGLEWRPALG